MPRALITGGTGFLGLHLANYLLAQDQEVVLLDNLWRGPLDHDVEDCLARGARLINADATDPATFSSRLDDSFDCVYHFAAINGTRHFYEIPDQVLRVNLLCTINVLDWFVSQPDGKLVFASSSECYAGTSGTYGVPLPTPEAVTLAIPDMENPRFSYAASKIAGELLVINYCRRLEKRFSIIRFHNAYGSRMGKAHVIPEFILRALSGEDPVMIYGAENTRDFCHVSDVVRAVELIMGSAQTDSEVYHLGSGQEETRIGDLAEMVLRMADRRPRVEEHPAPAGSVARRMPDISKLASAISYRPEVRLEDGLHATFKWYEDRYRSAQSTVP